MRVSELISYLHGVQSEHGDIEVWGYDAWPKRASLDWFTVENIDNKEKKSLSFAYRNAEEAHKKLMKQRSEENVARESCLPKSKKSKKGAR